MRIFADKLILMYEVPDIGILPFGPSTDVTDPWAFPEPCSYCEILICGISMFFLYEKHAGKMRIYVFPCQENEEAVKAASERPPFSGMLPEYSILTAPKPGASEYGDIFSAPERQAGGCMKNGY